MKTLTNPEVSHPLASLSYVDLRLASLRQQNAVWHSLPLDTRITSVLAEVADKLSSEVLEALARAPTRPQLWFARPVYEGQKDDRLVPRKLDILNRVVPASRTTRDGSREQRALVAAIRRRDAEYLAAGIKLHQKPPSLRAARLSGRRSFNFARARCDVELWMRTRRTTFSDPLDFPGSVEAIMDRLEGLTPRMIDYKPCRWSQTVVFVPMAGKRDNATARSPLYVRFRFRVERQDDGTYTFWYEAKSKRSASSGTSWQTHKKDPVGHVCRLHIEHRPIDETRA